MAVCFLFAMGQVEPALVLIVDDDADAREVLERMLRFSGYEVATARDGLEALVYLRQGGRASAIILDVAMPRMDGVAFRRALSLEPLFATIPIIVHSGELEWHGPDVFAVCRKGIDPEDLLSVLALVARPAR